MKKIIISNAIDFPIYITNFENSKSECADVQL